MGFKCTILWYIICILCVHHPKANLLPSPLDPLCPLLPPRFPFPSGNHHTGVYGKHSSLRSFFSVNAPSSSGFWPGNTNIHWILAGALKRSRNPCAALPSHQLGLHSSKTCFWVDASYWTVTRAFWGKPNALVCNGTGAFQVASEQERHGSSYIK